MARTKKQTLVNACERRRQIQEEIRRETLAAKQKRESFPSAVNVHSAHNGVPIANVQTVSRLEKMDNGTDVSSDSDAADHCQAVSTGSQETMSSLTHAASDASLFNEGNLPKAIICIPDICRSPTKLAAEEAALQEQSSKGQGLWGKASSHSKPREESVRKCSSSKHSEKNSEEVMASLRSLKAASEKVREEKSRKSRQTSCASAQTSSSGRRSPRQSSLLSSDAQNNASRKGLKDATSFSDEKPKVNIFTDNLGKDLGKRIRSPRRLSEDMIALPIFSARRWSNSPKDSSTASCLGSIYDGMETLSLHTPPKLESFKSSVSPSRSKQSSICESSKKSPSPGSSKLTRNLTTAQEQYHVESDESSPPIGTTSVDFAHEKCIHLELKTEPLCEDILQTFPGKYAKPAVLCSDEIKASVQSGNICSVFNNSPHVVDDCDSLGGSRKSGTSSASFPNKDRPKLKTQDDADNQKSSTCKELMSTGMLIKCENRCLNDTGDSCFDAKTDVSEDTDLVCKVKTDVEEVKNSINAKIKSSSQFGSDTEKETNRNKCSHLQNPALPVPLEIAEEKPQSSLLCAMLVGGTEVAHSYSQERVRVKSQGGDKSDSELDMVKCESSYQVSRSLPPQQSAAYVRHKIHKSGPHTVGGDEIHKKHKSSPHTVGIDEIHKSSPHTVGIDEIHKSGPHTVGIDEIHKSGPHTVGIDEIHKSGPHTVGIDEIQKSGPHTVGIDEIHKSGPHTVGIDEIHKSGPHTVGGDEIHKSGPHTVGIDEIHKSGPHTVGIDEIHKSGPHTVGIDEIHKSGPHTVGGDEIHKKHKSCPHTVDIDKIHKSGPHTVDIDEIHKIHKSGPQTVDIDAIQKIQKSGPQTVDIDKIHKIQKSGPQTIDVDEIHKIQKSGPQTIDVDEIHEIQKSGPQTIDIDEIHEIHKFGPQIVDVDEIHEIQKSGSQTVDVDQLNSQDSNALLAEKKSDEILPCDKVTTYENTTAETSTCELAASVKVEDKSDITDESKAVEKTEPVHFYKKLKQVNESVLKLIDIDVEEEFLQELEVDDSVSDEIVEDKQSDALSHSEQCQSALYSLISSLGTRLQCADSQTPFYTPVDLELVGKLMESCPKNAPNIMPRLKTAVRKKLLNKRMKEENVKEIKKNQNGRNEEELCVEGDMDEGDCDVDHQDSLTTSNITDLHSEKDDSQAITDDNNCADKKATNNEHLQEMDSDAGSSMCVPVSHLENTSSHTATVSSIVHENIDQNANAKDSTVTSLVNLNAAVDLNSLQKCSERLQTTTDMIKVLPADISTRRISETPTRLSFQKSKTCDDFNERLSANPASHAGTLRRVNSSPQMNTKHVLPPVSSSSPLNYTPKDNYTKSKLGSKIPVPGTSYVTKCKKSWRIPRTIAEPKPLSVLTDLEKPSSQPASAFTCPTLQKYLNVPSNRVIVTSDMQEEMKILDAQAKEQEEINEKMMEDKDKSMDDDINLDYKNCEPDFDEVDGMLFMSFFSEIELRAHVIVEKALEWDKDDTMLRVSRAKAFEEAKAQKEDMGHYKLKHLRGQHMRWKKYRRMYSNEVKALMEAQNVEQSYDDLPVTKKTSDLSKIKGWKRKHTSMPDIGSDMNDNFNWSFDAQDKSFSTHKKEEKQCFSQAEYDDAIFDDGIYFMSENVTAEDGDKPEMSARSRRRQGFSHQKAHRQLFRELNMDWEDRMIHRKLGGWSLKGNRPQAFSSAAKKRKEQKSKEVESGGFEMKDMNMEAGILEEIELETIESKDLSEDHKKRRTIKLIYPLLTEKMARNALKTLIESGDIQRGMRRKKNRARQSSHQLPALTPVICKSEPEDETASIQLSDSASFVLSTATTLLTPSAAPSFTSLSSPSTSAATVPLEIDLQDEPVMEGVDIAAESISSPSVTDTASMKSCGKPGCRYGCICHLCSVNESSAPLPSPLSKQPAPACDKEYCRLGCICDSIDPERPISSKTHCRRPSCMLQCICLETGSFDGNEDIPYLPSMRRRPKPGDRFSNLPQREKTHRSAKNLDAVTRKALMLYETSEIYCERVERSRKRPEITNSPASTSFDSSFLSPVVPTCSTATFDIDIVSDPSEDSNFQADIFSADVSVKSEVAGLSPSHPVIVFNTSPQHQHLTRNNTVRLSKPAFILDDVRQTVCVMEPSAHKRKRKSHPLSDEMFISSTCARTQPFKCLNTLKGMRVAVTNKDSEENIEISPSTSADSTCPIPSSTLLPLPSKPVDLKLTESDDDSKQMIPKISSVHTLASEKGKDVQQWENTESETALSHCVVTSPDSVSHQRMKNVTALQHGSAQNSVSNTSSQGNLRQFHGWHKSMVCLKARAPPSSQDPGEDDVKEEDEVKLLEFAANCNWEGAKREILAKVAQCLTRGQYPQPRTMNVCEFVVEILPKAHQPSHIPAELRAKLPGQMYSIRVRITRRESLSKKEDDSDVIDLSGSSPVKSGSGNDISVDSSLKESPFTSADQKPGKATSDSSFLTSNSVGISGLSKLFITSPPVSGQHQTSSSDNQSVHSSQTVGAHSFRRQSLESALVINSPDYKQATGHHTMTVQASSGNKPKGSSFLRFENSASQKAVGSAFSSESIKTVTSTAVSSSLKTANSNTTSKKLNIKPLNVSQTNQPFVPKPVSSGVTPIFGPFNAKDVKYMMSGKDGTMQLIEIAPTGDKNKKLIAVPITLSKAPVDLKGKQSAVVALPVSGMGQSRIVPVLSPPTASSQLKTTPAQQIVLRLPSTQASPGVRHPVVLQPMPNSVKSHPPRFQVVPLQVSNCVTVPQPKVVSTTTATTTAAVQSCTSTAVAQKPVNSSDEMIMVFDAAHIKASHAAGSSVSCAVSVSTHDTEEGSESCTTVTHSNERLESPTDNTSTKQQNKNVTQAFTVGKGPLEHHVSVDKRTENVIHDVANSTSDHLINILGDADSGDGIESSSQGDCISALHSSDLNVLETKTSSSVGQLNEDKQLPEVSVEAEVSVDNTEDINSDLSGKEDNLIKDALVKYTHSENATTSRKNYSSMFSNSPVCVKEHIPRTLQEFAVTGSKRLISAVTTLEEPLSPAMKRPCLAVENPIILDEDSVASLNSVSGIQQCAASPLSSIDRPKSVMSGAMSTGSSEDMLILLSSEEDIDVGEDDRPDDIISYRVRVERALQNDHGSMYTKVDPAGGAVQGSLKKTPSSDDIVRQNGLNHEDRDMSRVASREQQHKYSGKDLQKVNHHNQLERLRRSRMKILFDELQQHVLKQRGLPRDHIMSKVKVLVEAKKVVLHLNKCVLEGSELVKLYERKNRSLQNKLAALKGNLMQHNVSAETISSVMQTASENFLLHSIKTEIIQPPEDKHDSSPTSEVMHPLTVDVDIDDSQDMVNLVSPSTDGDKVSERLDMTTPVYEDISDPEDASTHT